MSTIDKIHLKCDVIDGSVLNGIREPIVFSLILDKPKPAGYNVFCQPKTIHYKNVHKSVSNTITFYLENNSNEVDFNHETMTFTLQLINI